MIDIADLACCTSATNSFDLLLSALAPGNRVSAWKQVVAAKAIFNSYHIASLTKPSNFASKDEFHIVIAPYRAVDV
jgi:hypothetical protein